MASSVSGNGLPTGGGVFSTLPDLLFIPEFVSTVSALAGLGLSSCHSGEGNREEGWFEWTGRVWGREENEIQFKVMLLKRLKI